jgi:hypothetical protein
MAGLGESDPEADPEHWRYEQSGHLDGINPGLFYLMTMMMLGHSWVGIYLNSGRYVGALKKLALDDFWRFKQEFAVYPCVDASGNAVLGGKTFKDTMPGDCDQAKLRAAWKAYADFKLRDLNLQWKRVYVRIPEGALLLSSMATFHFGSRFPLVFSRKVVPDDLWHMRMHS